jgi:hypothetical protein
MAWFWAAVSSKGNSRRIRASILGVASSSGAWWRFIAAHFRIDSASCSTSSS